MFSPSTLRHNQRAICTASLYPSPAAPHRILLSPVPYAAPRAFPHPSLSTTLEIHLVAASHPVSPRLVSPRFFLFLTLCHNLSSPRRSRSRCNERCTLLSSCSHRRCFYSAAQSVSAQLPTRFARRFASVVQVAFGINQN